MDQTNKLFALHTSSDSSIFGREFQKQKRIVKKRTITKVVGGYIPSNMTMKQFAVSVCAYMQAIHMNNGYKGKGHKKVQVRLEFNESN